MQKEKLSFDVYLPGTRFWLMHSNQPKEFIIRNFAISYYIDNGKGVPVCRTEYVIDHYSSHFPDGGGAFHSNSYMEDPIYFTREKLIASLF